jgi:ribonuclease D
MNTEKSDTSFDYIATPDALLVLLDAMKAVETIAIDTEADSFHHFHHKVCLIQLAVGSRCFIVDPLAEVDFSDVLAILAQKQLIFHDAGYDLRMMRADFGFRPQNEIFDTMLAARLVGLENVSLSALLEEILGIRLSKHNQRADWSLRPVSPGLLAYAVEDIRHLISLAEHLRNRLISLQRLEWHREYCNWTIEQTQQIKEPQDPEKTWRIRGTYGLSARQMAFVKALWQWRQSQSKKADLSPFRILRNEQLIELSLWAEQQKVIHPDKLPRLPRHCNGSRRRELVEALQTAHRLEPDQWPKPLRNERAQKPSSEILDKTDLLKNECRKIAESLGLAPQLIASRKSLLAAVNTHADTEEKLLRIGWMHWQANLILPSLRNVLNCSTVNFVSQEISE